MIEGLGNILMLKITHITTGMTGCLNTTDGSDSYCFIIKKKIYIPWNVLLSPVCRIIWLQF